MNKNTKRQLQIAILENWSISEFQPVIYYYLSSVNRNQLPERLIGESERIVSILENINNIRTIKDLCSVTFEDLSNFKSIGEKSANTIIKAIHLFDKYLIAKEEFTKKLMPNFKRN